MHENHASIVALHRLKTFFKKSADTFASTQYFVRKLVDHWLHVCLSILHLSIVKFSLDKVHTKKGRNFLEDERMYM